MAPRSTGPPGWHCPWAQRERANSLSDYCLSLSFCPARMTGRWSGGTRRGQASSEESSWSWGCRFVWQKKNVLDPARPSFRCCWSRTCWGRFSLLDMMTPSEETQNSNIVDQTKWSLYSQGLNSQGHGRQFFPLPTQNSTSTTNEGKDKTPCSAQTITNNYLFFKQLKIKQSSF